MAESHVLSSSPKHTKFISENIDKESVQLLNNQTHLIYDGIRIKWSKDLCCLKKFVHNVVGLNGVWKSPGGRSKQFIDSNLDLTITWYPGKQNTLSFHGKEGESLKRYLVSVLQTNPVKNTDTSTDNLFYTTAEIPTETEPLLGELDKTFDSTNIDNNSSMHASHVCDCKIGSKALKDIQSDIAILQKQMKSTSTIIDSTNNIIESMSVILFPSGSESGSVPYDTRLDTLFREFSVILEEKDKTIKTLQEKLAHVENERASLNLTSEISGQNTPPNFQFNECSEQKIYQSNRNDNSDLKTQSTDELNKGNNRILNTLPITSPKDASLVRKQKVSRAYQNAKGEVNTKLNCNLSIRNRKNVDTCHRTRSSTLPLTKSLKDNLHHGTSQNGNIGRNPPSGHTRDKTNQIYNQSHSAKYKTNPFWKSQYRNRPPSCLRRPSKDWLNHLHLVRQITANCSPNTEMPSQPIAFLPLCGAI